MVSTLHTAAVVDNTSRPSGKIMKNINVLLTAAHTCIVLIQQISNKTPTRCCQRVCMQKNIKLGTLFVCAWCGVPLHPEGCYTRYHTLKLY
jgi:hypothetical protein